MNPDPNQPPPLQFDKADFAGQPTLACASCKTPITSEYYQINGQVICPACKQQFAKFGASGSDAGRIGLAVLLGIVAGFAGFLVYNFLTNMLSVNLSLLSVAVGWLVGITVRWAAKYRGGPIYQGIAMAITYVAVTAIYMPRYDHSWDAFVETMMAPFQGGVGIIGWAIIAFALYEAYIVNRKTNLEISGPFFTRQAPPPAAP